MGLLPLAFIACTFIGMYKAFEKMGVEGWKGIVPIYNYWVMAETVYGKDKAWKALLMFIPVAGPFFLIILFMDFAVAFGKDKMFGLGLSFLSPVFFMILGFDSNCQFVGSPLNPDVEVEEE